MIGDVPGALVCFHEDSAIQVYNKIAEFEPEKQYKWDQVETRSGKIANILVGRRPKRGSALNLDWAWDGWADPIFNEALDVVGEAIDEKPSDSLGSADIKLLFRIQMAYLLLWSSIERYLTLRYGLGRNPGQRIVELGREGAFEAGLAREVKETRSVFRSDKPKKKYTLDPADPAKSVQYYYGVRSNIVHRGKGTEKDFLTVHSSLGELISIFRQVLEAARVDAKL